MSDNPIVKRMLEDAHYEEECGTDTRLDEYRDALAKIIASKERDYGNYAEQLKDKPEVWVLMKNYCDVERKILRARAITEAIIRGEKIDRNKLVECWGDIANHSTLNLDSLRMLDERDTKD